VIASGAGLKGGVYGTPGEPLTRQLLLKDTELRVVARVLVTTASGADYLAATNDHSTNIWMDSIFLAARAPCFLDREPHVSLVVS